MSTPEAQAKSDYSAFALIVANLFVIGAVHRFQLELLQVLLVYWTQSVIIGVSYWIRMLALKRNPATGLYDGLNQFDGGKSYFALFFLGHYGGFHLGYLVILALRAVDRGQPIHFDDAVGLCALAFALNQAYSLWREIPRDRHDHTSMKILFWVPYPRVLPMHVVLLVVGSGVADAKTLPWFLALKIVADVGMHVVERRWLRPKRAAAET